MSTQSDLDAMDRIAMFLGGGLIVLAIPVMGLVVTLAGSKSPMYIYEMTQDGRTVSGHALSAGGVPEGATIVSSPIIDPNVRAYIVALGLLIFGVYGVYRLLAPKVQTSSADAPGTTAD